MLAGKTDYTVKAGSHEARASRELAAKARSSMPFRMIVSPRACQVRRARSYPLVRVILCGSSGRRSHRREQALHRARGVDRALHRKEMAAFHPFEPLAHDAPRHAEPHLTHFARARTRDETDRH